MIVAPEKMIEAELIKSSAKAHGSAKDFAYQRREQHARCQDGHTFPGY